MTVALLSHSDCGRHDTGWAHPEHAGRLRAIPSVLREDPELFMALHHDEGRHATADEIGLAHDAGYIVRLKAMVDAGGGRLDPDTVASPGSWDAATAGVGCVLDAIDLAVTGEATRSFCAVRPPGHHALRATGMGFCLLGNVGIGAHYARARHGMQRVLIVDWDVHHGNGTQALVEHEPGIRFVSMHQWPWYPGSGAAEDRGPHRTVWNLPMPPGMPADSYVDGLLRAVDEAARGFTPDIVLVSSGFDAMRGDPLGGFTLEDDDVGRLTRELVARAESWCGGRLVSSLEGGYDPALLARGVVTHLRALQGG